MLNGKMITLHPLGFLNNDLAYSADVLNDAFLSIDEMIELAVTSLHHRNAGLDKVENFLYHWVYVDEPKYTYRQTVNPDVYNQINELIHDIEEKIIRHSRPIHAALEAPVSTTFEVKDGCLKVRYL